MPVPSNSVVKWESLNIYIMVLIFLSGFFFFPFVRAIPFTERHGMTGNEEGGGGGDGTQTKKVVRGTLGQRTHQDDNSINIFCFCLLDVNCNRII